MSPFPSGVTLQIEALPDWYYRLDNKALQDK
jgi:hypothetical protein